MLEIIDFFNPLTEMEKVVILSEMEDLSLVQMNVEELNQFKVICLRAFHR